MSKYQGNIQAGIKAAGKDNVVLIGSTIMVELVTRERKTASGLFLADVKTTNKELSECVVVATGAGYFDEEEGTVELDTKIGDIIYVDPMNVRLLFNFPVAGYQPNSCGLVEESQILFRFRGTAALDAFRKGAGIND